MRFGCTCQKNINVSFSIWFWCTGEPWMSRGIRKKTEEKRKEDKRGVLWKRGKKKKEKGLAWAFGLVNFKEERERKKKRRENWEGRYN